MYSQEDSININYIFKLKNIYYIYKEGNDGKYVIKPRTSSEINQIIAPLLFFLLNSGYQCYYRLKVKKHSGSLSTVELSILYNLGEYVCKTIQTMKLILYIYTQT